MVDRLQSIWGDFIYGLLFDTWLQLRDIRHWMVDVAAILMDCGSSDVYIAQRGDESIKRRRLRFHIIWRYYFYARWVLRFSACHERLVYFDRWRCLQYRQFRVPDDAAFRHCHAATLASSRPALRFDRSLLGPKLSHTYQSRSSIFWCFLEKDILLLSRRYVDIAATPRRRYVTVSMAAHQNASAAKLEDSAASFIPRHFYAYTAIMIYLSQLRRWEVTTRYW